MLVKKDLRISVKGTADQARTLLIAASTEDVDRDGDRIMASGWQLGNFMKNPVVPWAHKYDQPPVAKALSASVENQKLTMRIQFATAEEYPFADTVFRLYKGGYLKAFSVGFNPIRFDMVERTVNGARVRGRDYLEQELWEVSACMVPSNPNALTLAKSVGILSSGDYERLSLEEEIRELADRMIAERISGIIERWVTRRSLDDRLHRFGIH